MQAQSSEWTGATSSDWSEARNWLGGIPTTDSIATINVASPHSTLIQISNATAGDVAVGQGQNSVGLLAIESGKSLTNFGSVVGNLAGSRGAVTISGSGSTWTNTADITVGTQGTAMGSVTVRNGGSLISNGGAIGQLAGSDGRVTIQGYGSTWTDKVGVLVGIGGRGTLTVSDGGVVNAPITIAKNAGSIGTLNIGSAVGDPVILGPGTISATSVAFGAGTGTLVFNHNAGSYAFAPSITGKGSVQVLSGSTTLTAVNSYSGGTTIAAGTLRVGNDSALGTGGVSLAGTGMLGFDSSRTVANPVTLNGRPSIDVSAGQSAILSGAISDGPAAGMLVKTGPGTLMLTNASTQGAGATIDAGTLQIGNGVASGSITGNVANNGTLVFDRPDAIVYTGVISGPGALTQAGTGTLTVTGASSYSGTTTISRGTLQVGAGGASGTISGNIVNNGTLVFDRPDAIVYTGVISGPGALTQAGTGTLTVTG
ncbi:autotransporter-associated beta strand repeat-containing protein, partial [Variovorax rhizosphaerae]